MMRKTLVGSLALSVALACTAAVPAGLDPAVATPPVAKKIPHTQTLHGETRVDNYFWLRDKKDPEALNYLKAENAYTAAVMKPTAGLQATLYKEMLGRIKQTDLSVPYREGEYYYYNRTEKGKQYPIHCRKRGSLEGKEEVTLDVNDLARGHKFLGLGAYTVSDDGNLLAYATDVTGFREYTLRIKDLRSGKLLPERIARVSGVAWAADNKTLFYATEDHAKRAYRLYRHVLGAKEDKLLYEEKDELYRIIVRRSRDKEYLFLISASSTTREVRSLRADRPAEEWRVVLPREVGHKYSVDHRDGLFYLLTNKDGKNFRLVTAKALDPRPSHWKELVPHRKDVLLERLDLFAGHAVLSERAGGQQRLRVLDLASGKDHVIDFPEPAYSVFAYTNAEFNTTQYRLNYMSLVTPATVIEYDLKARTRKVLKKTEVRGYDPAGYASERIYATAKDGTRIPVSLVYRRGFRKDGRSPLLLYGYGAYGSSLVVGFNPSRLSLLDRGVVFAMAHVRGGKEMGEVWHDQGKMLHKRNTFTDFIAVADHLVAQKYTAHERLAIEGGSAGGLLIGAVLNLRPDLCKVAVLHVPFVDVINSMLDEALPLTVGEFLEWGNPKVRKEYDYMKTYCPYTNLGARAYPSMLVRTSLNDSQVMYWEPAKYVAKLRALKTDKNPLLLRTNMAGGHGGSSGRYDALKEQAFSYAFMLTELGVAK
jgi:oligopeptidase B